MYEIKEKENLTKNLKQTVERLCLTFTANGKNNYDLAHFFFST